MPASHPALTIAQNQANGAATPSPSAFVIYDPISGPKGSPLDVRTITGYGADKAPIYANAAATQTPSTGAMSTGIGLGENDIITMNPRTPTTGDAIFRAGFNDNDTPGTVPTYAAGGPPPLVASSAISSTRLYIGGGRSPAQDPVTHVGTPNPYTAGIVILGSGNGGSRDAGSAPNFTGFGMKMVTATGAVAIGAVVETGWVNRANRSLVANESIFGSAVAASGAIS
jgi:hypothetical protein